MNGLKVPPQSEQAELGVLGGLMLDASVWVKVQGIVLVSDFYFKRNRVLFKALAAMLDNNEAVDVITVSDYLEAAGQLKDMGGLAYLGALAKDTPSASNVGSYAKIVREKSLLRQLISVCNGVADQAFSAAEPAQEIVARAESAIFEIGQRGLRSKGGFVGLKEVLTGVLNTMENNLEKPESGVLGLATGFDAIDAMTSGLQPANLIVVAGRPSMGKTAFAMNIAEHASIVCKKATFFFSMEMELAELGQRILSSNSSVPLKKIKESWTMTDTDWPLLTAGLSRAGPAPIFIDSTPTLTIAEVRTRCLRLIAESKQGNQEGLGLIVIDYIQLMGSDLRGETRNNQIEDITRGLKRLAKDLSVPILALSQLNRNLESRPNKRPVQSDLRESGGIEQDADLILFLYRDEVYNPDTVDRGIAEVIIAKHRNGELGTVRLAFEGANTRFRNLLKYERVA